MELRPPHIPMKQWPNDAMAIAALMLHWQFWLAFGHFFRLFVVSAFADKARLGRCE